MIEDFKKKIINILLSSVYLIHNPLNIPKTWLQLENL